MTIRLWDGLDDLNLLVGADFPDADEDALWRCADAWHQAASELRALGPDALGAGRAVLDVLGGDAGAAFATGWREFAADGDGLVEHLARACDELAAACDRTALEVEYAKIQYIAALVVLGATIASLVATIWAGGVSAAGIPVAVAAAQVTIRLVLMRLLTAVLIGAGVNAALDLVAQSIQRCTGHREAWNWSLTARAVEDGAVYGAVGGAVFLGGGRLAPGLMGTPAGVLAGAGATGLIGGVAAPLLHGEMPTARDVLLAMTSGVLGGLGPDLGGRRIVGEPLSGPQVPDVLRAEFDVGPRPADVDIEPRSTPHPDTTRPGGADGPELVGATVREHPAAGPMLAGPHPFEPRPAPSPGPVPPGGPQVAPVTVSVPGPVLTNPVPVPPSTAPAVPPVPAAGAVGVAPAASPPAPVPAGPPSGGAVHPGSAPSGPPPSGPSAVAPTGPPTGSEPPGTASPAGSGVTTLPGPAVAAPGPPVVIAGGAPPGVWSDGGEARPGTESGDGASLSGWELTDVEAVDLVRRTAFATPAGHGFYAADDDVRDFARAVHPADGLVTLDLHGTPQGFQIDDRLISPAQFAAALRDLIGDATIVLPAGHGIKLLSCDTATGGPQSPAAHVAQALGVPVVAPDLPVWTTLDGEEVVAGPVLVDGFILPADPPDGSWHRFFPDGRTVLLGPTIDGPTLDGATPAQRTAELGLTDHAPRGPDPEPADALASDGADARPE